MRLDFEVLETEAMRTVQVAGLTFDLRLDRIDRLNDGTLLVIDYKTGLVSQNPGSRRGPMMCNFRFMPASRSRPKKS